MFGTKLGIGTGIVAAILVVVIAVPAGAQRSFGQGERKAPATARTTPPAWLTAMQVRSEALNSRYGLGTSTLRPASATTAAWLVALSVRSDALNRKYGLGEYAVSK
jgi:hypothetical protein